MARQVDVEHDGLYLRHLLHDTGYPDIAGLIKKALDSVIPRKAIDFRTNVATVINQCMQSGGVPMFRTRYAKEPFPMNSVLMVCYMGRLKGVWLKDAPPEDIEKLRAKADGYMLMLRKYGQQPVGAVSIGNAAAYTGQAIVSEPINELRFFLNGSEVVYEDFEKEWIKEFTEPVPDKPVQKAGKKHVFMIALHGAGKPTELQQSLKEIEEKLMEARLDEGSKAVPFYHALVHRIEEARKLIPGRTPQELEKDRYLYAVLQGVKAILIEEQKHSEKTANMINAVRELERVLELERTTGRHQALRPLERV